MLKLALLGNCFPDLSTEVEIWYENNFKFFLGRLLERLKIKGYCSRRDNNGNTKAMSESCSKLTLKTPERINPVVVVSLFLTLNKFHAFFWCFHC